MRRALSLMRPVGGTAPGPADGEIQDRAPRRREDPSETARATPTPLLGRRTGGGNSRRPNAHPLSCSESIVEGEVELGCRVPRHYGQGPAPTVGTRVLVVRKQDIAGTAVGEVVADYATLTNDGGTGHDWAPAHRWAIALDDGRLNLRRYRRPHRRPKQSLTTSRRRDPTSTKSYDPARRMTARDRHTADGLSAHRSRDPSVGRCRNPAVPLESGVGFRRPRPWAGRGTGPHQQRVTCSAGGFGHTGHRLA
ncbi:hypothetical protein MLGJGCBP_01414 [Rhodococcus sp. T7]|nr:hypothetical protein MLGJGCBP_09552 [Rhodococcus sp. T7]KAF0965447.1 hypothetical protein MLGJGCBP_01414 [Rhodococcus sp. T7]